MLLWHLHIWSDTKLERKPEHEPNLISINYSFKKYAIIDQTKKTNSITHRVITENKWEREYWWWIASKLLKFRYRPQKWLSSFLWTLYVPPSPEHATFNCNESAARFTFFFPKNSYSRTNIKFLVDFLPAASSVYGCVRLCHSYTVIWIIYNVACSVIGGKPVECVYDWEQSCSAICRTCTINYMFGWLGFLSIVFVVVIVFLWVCCVSYYVAHFFSAIVDV